jgi:hypothetical protein
MFRQFQPMLDDKRQAACAALYLEMVRLLKERRAVSKILTALQLLTNTFSFFTPPLQSTLKTLQRTFYECQPVLVCQPSHHHSKPN